MRNKIILVITIIILSLVTFVSATGIDQGDGCGIISNPDWQIAADNSNFYLENDNGDKLMTIDSNGMYVDKSIDTDKYCLGGECIINWTDIIGDSTHDLKRVCETKQSVNQNCQQKEIHLYHNKNGNHLSETVDISGWSYIHYSISVEDAKYPISTIQTSNRYSYRRNHNNHLYSNTIYTLKTSGKLGFMSYGFANYYDLIPSILDINAYWKEGGWFTSSAAYGGYDYGKQFNIIAQPQGEVTFELEPVYDDVGGADFKISYQTCDPITTEYEVCHNELYSDLTVKGDLSVNNNIVGNDITANDIIANKNIKIEDSLDVNKNANIKGLLTVTGDISADSKLNTKSLCINGDCKTSWNNFLFSDQTTKDVSVMGKLDVKNGLCIAGDCKTGWPEAQKVCTKKTMIMRNDDGWTGTTNKDSKATMNVDTTYWKDGNYSISYKSLNYGASGSWPWYLYVQLDHIITAMPPYISESDVNTVKTLTGKFNAEDLGKKDSILSITMAYMEYAEVTIEYTECVPVENAIDDIYKKVNNEPEYLTITTPKFEQYFGGGFNSPMFCMFYETDYAIDDISWTDDNSISRSFEDHGWHAGGGLTVAKADGGYQVCINGVSTGADGYKWDSFSFKALKRNVGSSFKADLFSTQKTVYDDKKYKYNWKCPKGINEVYVTAVGAGAGGGGSANNGIYAGTGGGAGDIVLKRRVSVQPGTTYSIVLGKGGAAGNSGSSGQSGTDGVSGGTTYLKSGDIALVEVSGGKRGAGAKSTANAASKMVDVLAQGSPSPIGPNDQGLFNDASLDPRFGYGGGGMGGIGTITISYISGNRISYEGAQPGKDGVLIIEY